MKRKKILAAIFAAAALCFIAGTINHIFNTGEGVISSLLLAAGCVCISVAFLKAK